MSERKNKVSQDHAPSITAVTSGQSHTPGPWQWDCGLVPPDGPEFYADIYKDGGDLIIAQFNELIPEGKANARLISAAPDLYEALREMLDMGELFIPAKLDSPGFKRARAAIAKVEGRAPSSAKPAIDAGSGMPSHDH